MKPMKIMEREYATPMLGGGILPMMNEAMSLGFSFKMMCLVALVSCIYAGLRIWNKNTEIKYGRKCGVCKNSISGGAAFTLASGTATAVAPPQPPAVPPTP